MKKIIYTGIKNIVSAESKDVGNVLWEIDNDDDLSVKVNQGEIEINPSESALNVPQRILKYTDDTTGEGGEIELIIEKREKNIKGQKESILEEEKVCFHNAVIPERMSVNAGQRVLIPGSNTLPKKTTWTFSDENLNSYINLTAEGVYLEALPDGFFSLYYEIPGDTRGEIVIQCRLNIEKGLPPELKVPEKTIPLDNSGKEGKSTTKSKCSDTEEGQEEKSFPSPKEDTPEKKADWPKISGKCALEVKKGVEILLTYPVYRSTESIIIGKQSQSKKAVDIDLKQYSKDKGISRNHLKIWFHEDHLMMKNIGSHRVKYNKMELVPEKVAVLCIGGEIEIGDLNIIVTAI